MDLSKLMYLLSVVGTSGVSEDVRIKANELIKKELEKEENNG